MATPIDDEIEDIAARIPLIRRLEEEEASVLARLQDIRARLQEQQTTVSARLATIRGKLRP